MTDRISLRTNVTLGLAMVIVLLVGLNTYSSAKREQTVQTRLERIEQDLEAIKQAIVESNDKWRSQWAKQDSD